jgi:hypothetical protein
VRITHLIFSAKQLKKMMMMLTLNSLPRHLCQKRSALVLNAPGTEACKTKQNLEDLAKIGALSHQSSTRIFKSTHRLVFRVTTAGTQVKVARDFGVTSLTPNGNGTGTTAHHLQKLNLTLLRNVLGKDVVDTEAARTRQEKDIHAKPGE